MSNNLKTQAMKRLLTIGLMLASALAFTNCTEQLVDQNFANENILETSNTIIAEGEGIPYDVFVGDPETKTLIDYTNGYWRTTWLDQATIQKNNLNGVEPDQIILYSKPKDGTTYYRHGAFTYIGNQKFTGEIVDQSLAAINNWYSIYPYRTANGSTTIDNEIVTIGSKAVTQESGGSMKHICGSNHPMYGIKNNVSNEQSVRFKMSHLYALVALEIVNVGDGIKSEDNTDASIVINNAKFTAPEEIVGDFIVNILGDQPSFIKANNATNLSKVVDIQLGSPITIDSGTSSTIYFAVKPFNASGQKIKISINGSEKEVTMPANSKFEVGKMTTLRIPVSLSHPKTSDAMSFISKIDGETKTIIMNGEQIQAYVLHQTVEEEWEDNWFSPDEFLGYKYIPHSLTIKGNVKELFNALDAGFYASTWDGKPAAMTVSNINLWINGTQFMAYDPLLNALRQNLSQQPGLGQLVNSLWWLAEPALKNMFASGIARDGSLISLIKFMDPSNITFDGIVSNGATGDEEIPSLFFLDDSQLHKLVGREKIDELLSTKFDYESDLGEVILPTYNGLMDIINKSPNATPSSEAIRTARAIYGKLKLSVGNQKQEFAGLEIKVWDIFQALFPDELTMIEMLPTLTVSVTIEVYPYSTSGSYGSKNNAIRPDYGIQGDESDDLNPIILWGFDKNCN